MAKFPPRTDELDTTKAHDITMIQDMLLSLLKERREAFEESCRVEAERWEAERKLNLEKAKLIIEKFGGDELTTGDNAYLVFTLWDSMSVVDDLRVKTRAATMKLEHADAQLSAWKALARLECE